MKRASWPMWLVTGAAMYNKFRRLCVHIGYSFCCQCSCTFQAESREENGVRKSVADTARQWVMRLSNSRKPIVCSWVCAHRVLRLSLQSAWVTHTIAKSVSFTKIACHILRSEFRISFGCQVAVGISCRIIFVSNRIQVVTSCGKLMMSSSWHHRCFI